MENITKSYSTLQIKSIDTEQRIIKGIASTPSTDRDGDIVESRGAKFSLPYPLLAQHDHNQPIGEVVESRVTSKGIEITAKIVKGSGLGYVEDTYKKIKAGLIKGLSIGFRGIDVKHLEKGMHFKTYEILELSAVTVPANQDASIQSIKHYCGSSCRKKSVDLRNRKTELSKRAAAYLNDNK